MHHFLVGYLLLSLGTLISLVHSKTDSQDVAALNVMFKSLNTPSKLSGWRANGGDPCGDSWEGIKCSGSSVTEINLSNYGLSGQLGYQLSSLTSVTTYDLSKKNLNGDIPYQLPLNDAHKSVKRINSSLFQGKRPEGFSEIVSNISKLHHPNIAEHVGYCSKQEHNVLADDYFRNGSIHEFLHGSDDFSKPLTWNTRITIALGAARAVEYLHDVCSPLIVHKKIKSTNILLDLELNSHLSDYGMANFLQHTSQNLGMGYNTPECTKPSAYTLKSDVYGFGVVMLELLTGRMPLDSKRPKSEQCLVKWAKPQLHDIDALARMVDPGLRGMYPCKSLPPFADIIAICIQSEPKLRPPMSEVVQSLVQLVQQSSINMKDDLSTSQRTDVSDYLLDPFQSYVQISNRYH